PARSPRFPYTTLFRSEALRGDRLLVPADLEGPQRFRALGTHPRQGRGHPRTRRPRGRYPRRGEVAPEGGMSWSLARLVWDAPVRSEEHTSELQSRENL